MWKKSKNGGRRNLQVACFGCATWMVDDQAQQCSLLTAGQMRSYIGPPEAFESIASIKPIESIASIGP